MISSSVCQLVAGQFLLDLFLKQPAPIFNSTNLYIIFLTPNISHPSYPAENSLHLSGSDKISHFLSKVQSLSVILTPIYLFFMVVSSCYKVWHLITGVVCFLGILPYLHK